MLDMNKVAKNIKNARTKKNMTQLELADIVGVSYQAVSNWERGNSMPDIGKISDIAKALDMDVTELLGNDNGTTAVKKVLEKSPEPLTAEELTDVAPMLPPMELTEEVKRTSENEKLNIKALVGGKFKCQPSLTRQPYKGRKSQWGDAGFAIQRWRVRSPCGPLI